MSHLAYYLSAIALGVVLVTLHTIKFPSHTFTRAQADQSCAIAHRGSREILVCTEVYRAK